MRVFWLHRYRQDKTVSGSGIVAEGIEFSDGVAALRWLRGYKSVAIFPNVQELIRVHGHGGETVITFLRPPCIEDVYVTEADLPSALKHPAAKRKK